MSASVDKMSVEIVQRIMLYLRKANFLFFSFNFCTFLPDLEAIRIFQPFLQTRLVNQPCFLEQNYGRMHKKLDLIA